MEAVQFLDNWGKVFLIFKSAEIPHWEIKPEGKKCLFRLRADGIFKEFVFIFWLFCDLLPGAAEYHFSGTNMVIL